MSNNTNNNLCVCLCIYFFLLLQQLFINEFECVTCFTHDLQSSRQSLQLHGTAVLTWNTQTHKRTSSLSLRFDLLWLIFPAVCASYPPWWTQRRPLSPEVCGEAHTERHSDLQRAAQPYCNAALPELYAVYERFRLQPERQREKWEERSMWEQVKAYCVLKTRDWWWWWWCTWLR